MRGAVACSVKLHELASACKIQHQPTALACTSQTCQCMDAWTSRQAGHLLPFAETNRSLPLGASKQATYLLCQGAPQCKQTIYLVLFGGAHVCINGPYAGCVGLHILCAAAGAEELLQLRLLGRNWHETHTYTSIRK
eukprot:1160256-Pelagomonas_calceolata.AAC.13